MSMKKALDQTLRDIKRGVNKKVLKVSPIEQKVLDATSNEPWGPHGSLLAEIAQATRNYNEYPMIMSVIWKRINDTGKNWRHVYKALALLEYLAVHGSERVIDEIREHAYQISVKICVFLLIVIILSVIITFSLVNLMFSTFKLTVFGAFGALNLFLQTLSDFQYIDSSGRDQENNVRRKAESLVVLVNDKEKIQEARVKAASNMDE